MARSSSSASPRYSPRQAELPDSESPGSMVISTSARQERPPDERRQHRPPHQPPRSSRARRSPRSTPPTSWATCSRCPEHLRDAVWRVESAIMQDWDTSAGLVVAGMGGSAIGGALARAALGDHASRPIFVTRAYGLPTWTTPDTMVLCASYSGRHRGDARLLRVGRRARRQAHRRHDRRAPRRDGARRRRPGDPAAGRLSAARGGRLHDRRRARGRRALRRRAAADVRDRRRRLAHRAARRRVGARRAGGLARQGDRPRACTGPRR